jgi:hypothetical protein
VFLRFKAIGQHRDLGVPSRKEEEPQGVTEKAKTIISARGEEQPKKHRLASMAFLEVTYYIQSGKIFGSHVVLVKCLLRRISQSNSILWFKTKRTVEHSLLTSHLLNLTDFHF